MKSHFPVAFLPLYLLTLGCGEKSVTESTPTEDAAVKVKIGQPEYYVGESTGSEWPYRYTLVKTQDQWTGEIEILWEGGSIFFDKMNVISSSDQQIIFEALFGGIGKARPAQWELSLSKSGNDLNGLLVAKGGLDGIKPVQLKFGTVEHAVLPSSELEGKLRLMDDAVYRAESALEHELSLAKQEWESESAIAERIAELRSDDGMRRGIRREWIGPAWVREKVNPEDSKYFERICCVYLGGTEVTDKDVLAISSLTQLRELYLHRTGISDAALEHIGRLQALRILHLPNTVSDRGGEKLRAALPNVDIEW